MDPNHIVLRLIDRGMSEIDLDAEVSSEPPWRIKLSRPIDGMKLFQGSDMFECLKNVRLAVERQGQLVLCQGSRPNVVVSPMQRCMGAGRVGYEVQLGRPARMVDLVDVFEPAPFDEVGTVHEQEEFERSWLKSLK